jgi:EAL domain-containing protein (putative c-di-GMP-specific phosphodiesterase class I)/GGDEF domain-containing protein
MSPARSLRGWSGFRNLRTRMTILYAALFSLALGMTAIAVLMTVGRVAGGGVEQGVEGSASVYQSVLVSLVVISALGLAGVIAGSWILSRSLTRPISDLDRAVQKLKQGEHVQVPVASDDELGRLAASFNAMIGDLRDREARLTHMALHDMESGLPNRLALERLAARRRDGWVILFGLDRFEVVRNAIGYDSMARLVTTLGQRISALADGAPVARIGAGALGVVVHAQTGAEALALARRLGEAAHAPVKVNGAPVDIAVTAGVAGPTASSDTASPIDRAAIAVEQARRTRRAAALFDPTQYGDPAGNLSLISELMAALHNGEFSLAYQPKYDFRADRITGVEALARWTHPRRGVVPPDLFVGMAEETGHIRPLTEWVIQRALADQRLVAQAGHDIQMSVNVSGRLLTDDAFADGVLAMIGESGARLCIEITETAVMDNPERALGMIERFAAAGVAVSLDDYGSGLSSLAYLKRIPANELKIDKAFVMGMDQSSRDALLVKSTIDLAHGLGLRITAEGVESPTALALLRGMGCDMAQGYLIGRPAPLEALLEQLGGSGADASSAVA